MKKTYCDICGALIPDVPEPTDDILHVAEGSPAFCACPHVFDLCEACQTAGHKIDVEGMVLKEWKRLVGVGGRKRRAAQAGADDTPGEQEEKSEKATHTEPGLKQPSAEAGKTGPGSHWATKKKIFAQLLEYRRKTGLGTLPALAEKADVPCEVLRQMLESKPQPIDMWRKVGVALDDMGISAPGQEG